MKNTQHIIALFFILFFTKFSFAQKEPRERDTTKLRDKIKEVPQVIIRKSNKEFTLKGTITDKKTKEPLIGVNIFVEGDQMKGTVTDFDGKYEMKVNEGDQVVFRYVGYEDQKLAATGSQTFDLIMMTEIEENR